jgi:hypothetical protein
VLKVKRKLKDEAVVPKSIKWNARVQRKEVLKLNALKVERGRCENLKMKLSCQKVLSERTE